MNVEVVRASEKGVPLTIRVDFEAPLEDARYVFLSRGTVDYIPIVPPNVAASVRNDIDEQRLLPK